MKLCLGTVQFGMNYGIRSQKQPLVKEAIMILDYATQNGIDMIRLPPMELPMNLVNHKK
jgi:aryl-alcohol dehydrogenase-like predicted oxidoreductase